MKEECITIQAKGLKKSYNGVNVVNELSLTAYRGQIFGLLGANGAGKTTAIECVLGTKAFEAGMVEVLGMNPVKERRKLFERVGVQFQESAYQEKITVRELCEVTAALYRQPANYEKLLMQFGLSDKKKSCVSELSGGQRQRLFIVLALIPEPEVIFLDELTTGLDAKARREVWKYLEGMKEKGLTILLTSHFMDEVEILCDTILILKQGRTVFSGTVKQAIEASPAENLEDAYLWYTDDEGSNEKEERYHESL
ncbi:ABC transporter ATP-binding protein [Anoxybacterium hadale]|uniref:ABC transporter ATP-binding protein n=1 Tax=Anoxybacterium hadale TaxID=3408580 RepID=A0ACD1A958_9FIRM|nr:ABC transporter ATP-binding protein [Clostridiales bacterium]